MKPVERGEAAMANPLLRTNNEITEIFHRRASMVYGICLMFMKNRADTEDAVSDTFFKLINASPAFCSQEHEKNWLIRTASNVCKDMLKSAKRKTVSLDDSAQTTELPDEDAVLSEVLKLPERYKTAVYLHYYEGYTCPEIAEILRKPQSTIRNHLHEARKLLRETLGGELDET